MLKAIRTNLFKTFLFLAPLLISCVGDHYHNIPDDEKFFFKKSDTLVYLSNLNRCDSFYIEDIENGYSVYDKTDHVQYQNITIKPIGKTSITKCSFSNRYYSCTLSWGDYIYGFRLEEKEPITCTINNRVFEKVYKLSENDANRDKVNIFYNYKYGVIQYRLSDNEIYILTLND